MATLAIGAGAAVAVITGRSGTFSERQTFVHNTEPTVISTTGGWSNVPNAFRTVSVPSGTSRMVDARFSAESMCSGSATSGWCSLRIVILTSAGGVIELDPASGTDFAFDSGGDRWESHAVERTSRYLPAGTYTVRVQAQIRPGATSLRLDDWTLAVELIRP